jgi:group I intron endonuclease
MAFLYQLTAPNGKSYLGITVNAPEKRWGGHAASAKKDSLLAIHCAIRKYGWDNFKKEVLVEGSTAYIKELEVKAILAFNTLAPFGYNLTKGGDGVVGYQIQQIDRDKNSAAVKKAWTNPAFKTKMAILRKETWADPEYKERMRNTHIGRKASAETKAKISAANIGKKHTAESKAKMSLNTAARQPDVRKRMSLAKLGKKHTPEAIEKMSLNAASKRPEVRAKLSEAHKNLKLLICPTCGKSSTSPVMYHWHFDNCKLKEVL